MTMQNSTKAELVSLYIKPEHYNTDYNFYNYHKFKATGIINIIYKTPSIFLNGLYFELPYVQIIDIIKKPGSASFEMKLCFTGDSLASNQNITNILSKIDKFNTLFFRENASKFEIKTSQTNKSCQYVKKIMHGDEYIESHASGHNGGSSVGEKGMYDKSAPHGMLSRFRNPFLKKYEYKPFININNENQICITVEIIYIYMLKICELIKANQHLLSEDSNKKLIEFANNIIQVIGQEFYDFRKSSYSYNLLQEHVELCMKFWVKCNSFEVKNNNLDMIWKICGYQL
jgi:hypothetical protein